jgi:dienelactone hydrolase
LASGNQLTAISAAYFGVQRQPEEEAIVITQQVEIPTADGTGDALLVRPDTIEMLPGVIDLTDGIGFRQAFADQSERIAERGFAGSRLSSLQNFESARVA